VHISKIQPINLDICIVNIQTQANILKVTKCAPHMNQKLQFADFPENELQFRNSPKAYDVQEWQVVLVQCCDDWQKSRNKIPTSGNSTQKQLIKCEIDDADHVQTILLEDQCQFPGKSDSGLWHVEASKDENRQNRTYKMGIMTRAQALWLIHNSWRNSKPQSHIRKVDNSKIAHTLIMQRVPWTNDPAQEKSIFCGFLAHCELDRSWPNSGLR
jgi:hypothetical protein